MKLVWELGEPTVREVYEAMREQRKVAYTTVMTMLNVLVEKGVLGELDRMEYALEIGPPLTSAEIENVDLTAMA